MTTCLRVLILTIYERCLVKILICTLYLASSLNYITHHMDTDKIGHFGIHFLSFEQLER